MRGTYVHPRGVRVFKTFGYVENTAEQLYALAHAAPDLAASATVYLGDPPLEVGAFAELIARTASVSKPRRTPRGLLAGLAKVGDFAKRAGLSDQPPLTSTRLRNLTTDMVFDLDDIARICPPRVSLEEGVRRTVTWMDREGLRPTTLRSSP
jgi:nucleoside-diphosphate-sugar epimerase